MLNIITTTEKGKPLTAGQRKRVALEAKYERAWLLDPERFNPERDAVERVQQERAWQMIAGCSVGKVADLACGWGFLTRRLLERGHEVDAVDVASNALKRLPSGVRRFQQAVPRTLLEDYRYDLVLACNVVEELEEDDYRLFTSEVQRLMKREGLALISSRLDYKTHEPLRVFLELLNSEFEVERLEVAHHRLPHFNRVELMERVSRFLFPDSGVTHAMALVRKKKLRKAGEGSWLQ